MEDNGKGIDREKNNLGGVKVEWLVFFGSEETGGEKKAKKRCCAERNWTFDC